jgi:hypothetical protein
MTFVLNRRSSKPVQTAGEPAVKLPQQISTSAMKEITTVDMGCIRCPKDKWTRGNFQASMKVCLFYLPQGSLNRFPDFRFSIYHFSNSNKIAMSKAHTLIMIVLPVILSQDAGVLSLIHS